MIEKVRVAALAQADVLQKSLEAVPLARGPGPRPRCCRRGPVRALHVLTARRRRPLRGGTAGHLGRLGHAAPQRLIEDVLLRGQLNSTAPPGAATIATRGYRSCGRARSRTGGVLRR